MNEKKETLSANEEFSVEFGDINGMKLFEIPNITQNKHKKMNPKKQK